MSNSPSKGAALMACTRFSLDRSTSSLWRVTFDNPPINLIDPVMIVALHDLLTEIEQDNRVAVVVFASADPDFFLAHYAIAADQSAFDALPAAPSPFHHWADFLIRLAKSRAVTISALRGRARGAGNEFALATDIRFASRERPCWGSWRSASLRCPGAGPRPVCQASSVAGGRSRYCSGARTSTGNSPRGTDTSNRPCPPPG